MLPASSAFIIDETSSISKPQPEHLVLLLEPADDLVVVLRHPGDVGLGRLDRALGRPLAVPELVHPLVVKLLQLVQLKLLVEGRRAGGHQAAGRADAARQVVLVDLGPVASEPVPG